MQWGKAGIRGTIGGEGSAIEPGWVNDQGFVSVTVEDPCPSIHYVFVTTAPNSQRLALQVNEGDVRSVHDLRTGKEVRWSQPGYLEINPGNWDDVAEFGAAGFQVEIV